MVKLAAIPLNLTSQVVDKFVPAIATTLPTAPLLGEKLVIVAGAPQDFVNLIVGVPVSICRANSAELNSPIGTLRLSNSVFMLTAS